MSKLQALRSRRAAVAVTAAALAAGGVVGIAGTAGASHNSIATVTNLRAGGHSGFDRVVLDYQGAQPVARVKFVPALYACGSGEKLTLPGNRILQIDLTPARAHRNNGSNAYVGPGRLSTSSIGLTTVKGVRMACDFEGHVTFGIGVQNAKGFTTAALANPNRFYVDIKR